MCFSAFFYSQIIFSFLFLSSLWPWLNFRESEDLVSGPVCRDCASAVVLYLESDFMDVRGLALLSFGPWPE